MSGVGTAMSSEPRRGPVHDPVEPVDQLVADAEKPTREPLDMLLRNLRTSAAGLESREAERRLAIYGPNVLPQAHRATWPRALARQITHPLALLLFAAAVLALVAGTPTVCWAILAVIAINAVVAFAQETQAARAVQALARYLPPQARVIRSGAAVLVAADQVVPGDVLLIDEGDRISADARLIDGSLEVDLSALTGESIPVTRSARERDTADRLIDAPDAVFSGTSCTSGRAPAVVFATGAHTELGRIAALSQRRHGRESPLERQVRRGAWVIAAVAVAMGVLFLPLGLLAGLTLANAVIFAIGLLVANVPEGLLPTITLALAVGVRKLARAGALVKRLSAVETLGSTTVICTDKTGTLTQNRMQVVELWSDGQTREPRRRDPALHDLAEVMADCGDPLTADPMERALRDCAEDLGVTAETPLVAFPFDPRRRRMSVVTDRGAGPRVQVKGAPEAVLPLCTSWLRGGEPRPLTPAAEHDITCAVNDFAARGLRVLALASRPATGMPTDAAAAERELCLLGVVALLDPPRPEVPAAVADCHRAGIRIHVVTGDHARTATEIARQVGIGTTRAITGPELDAMSDDALDRLLAGPDEIVFARATPENKLRIAEALQHEGHVVAMTGDGVNDAPALHQADIGVAMGLSGTDVAREAATMVLTDDNFATIVTAVREGRRAYANLRKFVLYIFTHAIPEAVPFAVFVLTAGAVPIPIGVLQILAIDLGTDTLPAQALGREHAEPDLMDRSPRPRKERLITPGLLGRAWLLMGMVSAALTMTMYLAVLLHAGWHPGAPVGPGSALHDVYRQATTITFATIVACQIGTAFAARTERASLRSIGPLSNRLLLAAIGGEIAFAAILIYLPVLQPIFGTAPPPGWAITLLPVCSAVVWGADELHRFLRRARTRTKTRGMTRAETEPRAERKPAARTP